MLTLAHELGHGVHAALGGRQGIFHMATPLTLAETAQRVRRDDRVRAPARARRDAGVAALAAGRVDRGLDRHRLPPDRHEPVRGAHPQRAPRARRARASTTSASCGRESQEELLGDAVEVTDNYRSWWSYVHHFVSVPGYVYAYAYGQLLALAVYGRYEEEGEAFVPAYLQLLEAGGSRSPEELGRIVGIDLADPGFWDRGLALVERQLDAAEQAAREAGRSSALGGRSAAAAGGRWSRRLRGDRTRVATALATHLASRTAASRSARAPLNAQSEPQHRPRDDPRERGELVDATRSSTAWASSRPLVPTITVGMPRAQKSRMSAP